LKTKVDGIMKILSHISSIVLCLVALSQTTLAGALPPVMPHGLEAPSDQALAFTLTGKGVQIYVWGPVPDVPNKSGWVLKAPEADLFDASGKKVGRHFAGPTWQLSDGGKVVGRVKAKVDAPDGKGIPWLLLEAVEASGTTMGKVKSIQRIETVGGSAPAAPADATKSGAEQKVEYSATYRFFKQK
jgi:hypothetical protein